MSGSISSSLFQLHLDGANGSDAANGANGSNGYGNGAPGRHGQDAGQPTPGRNAGRADLYLSTATEKEMIHLRTASVAPSHSPWAEPELHEYMLNVGMSIETTVTGGRGGDGGRGGKGGNGSRGRKGKDASRYSSGKNGGPGGPGGDGGNGSSGSPGGDGGTIGVHLSDDDSYLLMTVMRADAPAGLVQGGRGGNRGSGGGGGTGGPGGKGGKSYRWTDSDGNSHYRSGGSNGRRGADGRDSRLNLTDGRNGKDGRFTIHISDQQHRQYSSRYDLRLASTLFYSDEKLHETNHFFQFSDTVQVQDIDVDNVGGMVSPLQQSEIQILASEHITPVADDVAFVEKRVGPGKNCRSLDTLSFRVPVPNIRAMGDDMKAFHCQDRMHLRCTQLGPNSFARDYENFDHTGKLLEFSFPVENKDGLRGLPTIRAGDRMRVRLVLTNTSPKDLGSKSQSCRQLFVQFYRNHKACFDVASHHVNVDIENTECNTKLDENTSPTAWRGTRFPIHFLASGEKVEISGTLRLSAQVAPYSSFALQAELVLQDLPHTHNKSETEPVFSPIQRRQLVVSSEPTYWPSAVNQVVLITSSATTKEEFVSWNTLFTDKLGLKVGYYSVSIYGSLNPDFEISDQKTLAQAFKGKLVVILDDAFNPLDDSVSRMNPSCMLPNGCQSQSSGFDTSTKWLLVGPPAEAVKQALTSHFNAPPTDVESFDSLQQFYRALKKKIREEQQSGLASDEFIQEYVIAVPHANRKRLKNEAKSLNCFLERWDRLRQYIVAAQEQLQNKADGTTYQTILVRRGYSRMKNSSNVLKGSSAHSMKDTSALLAVVESLPYSTLTTVFSDCISHQDEELIRVCLDAFTQALLWDLSNFLDGRFRVTDNIQKAFPSILDLVVSETMNALATQGSGPSRSALSRLLARFKFIAESRDLSPWWMPFSRKHGVRRALREMVASLEQRWSTAVLPSAIEEEQSELKEGIHQYLQQNTRFCGLEAPRMHNRWRKGILYACSHRNEKKYRATCGTFRLIEMETAEHTQKSRAIRPRKMLAKERDCRVMRGQAERQVKMADQLLASIQETRAREEIHDEDEIEISL